MNPFERSQKSPGSWLFGRVAGRLELAVFAVSLVFGLTVVAWRVNARIQVARDRARAEALIVSSALRLQLHQAISAAEMLGILERQGHGASFSRVAGELIAARPGIASLERQPGGIVSEVVPRGGNEKAIGFSVLKDPARRLAVNSALRQHTLAVGGPLRLHTGEPGLTAMAPVFQRGHDGRESFWGFVSASVRISEVLARARVDDLAAKGYDYVIFAPAVAGRSGTIVTESGPSPGQSAVQETLELPNLELRLALRPRAGWVNRTKLVLQCLGVLALSGLLSLVVGMRSKRRELEAASASTAGQLAGETEARKLAEEAQRTAEERTRAAQAEQQQMRAALKKVEANAAAEKARFAEAERSWNESTAALEARFKEAEARAGEMEIQLNASIRASTETAQAHRQEVNQLRAALQQAQQTITATQSRLDTAMGAEKRAIASAEARLKQDQTVIAELQAQVEATAKAARQAAEEPATRLRALEESNRELKTRLQKASDGEERAARLAADLEKAESELQRLKDSFRQSQGGTVADVALSPAAVLKKAEEEKPAPLTIQLPGPVTEPPDRPAKRRPQIRKDTERKHQMDLFAGSDSTVTSADAADESSGAVEKSEGNEPAVQELAATPGKPEQVSDLPQAEPAPTTAKEQKSAPARAASPGPAVNVPELRKAVYQILPLLTDQDPGAKDCLKGNRAIFRSAFSPEAYVKFEQSVKNGGFAEALEELKKAVRKHGVSV